MTAVVRLTRLNNLQYNPNRDPQAWRRCPGEAFRIQALLAGHGEVRCRLRDAGGALLAERTVTAPGTFTHEVAWDTPGSRLLALELDGPGLAYRQDLRLDVTEHAWIG